MGTPRSVRYWQAGTPSLLKRTSPVVRWLPDSKGYSSRRIWRWERAMGAEPEGSPPALYSSGSRMSICSAIISLTHLTSDSIVSSLSSRSGSNASARRNVPMQTASWATIPI